MKFYGILFAERRFVRVLLSKKLPNLFDFDTEIFIFVIFLYKLRK